MIGSLAGHVAGMETDRCLLEVNGVGYVVQATSRTLAALPDVGVVRLLIETQVREDAISLFGFNDASERDWFRLLTTVQGVGARVALSILSTLPPDELARAIAAGDKAALGRPSGVGPKLAARLATELKDKVPAIAAAGRAAPVPIAPAATDDAVSALLNLGYRPAEAGKAVAKANDLLGEGANIDQLIRAALKELAR